jgi:hypothetical protein
MTRATSHTTSRRAFALPMVMLLALIGVIVITSMLTRYESQNRFVHRHRMRYVEHHTQRGVQEMVGTWLDLVRGGPLGEIVQEDGLAFTLDMERGRRMEVYVHDGQGSLLMDMNAMNDRERQVIEGALEELRQDGPIDRVNELTRSRGPAAVSVLAAPPEVLRAILIAADIEGDTADRVVDDLIREREQVAMTQPDLLRLLGATGITPESRGLASAVLTVQPTLFAIETRVYDQRRGPMTAHYQGLVEVESRSGRGIAQSSFKPAGPFLSWEVLDVN